MRKIENMRQLTKLVFGILSLAGALCVSTGAPCVHAEQDQPSSVSGQRVQIYSTGQEEYTAYDAAMEIADPQKRAAKLYEFIQKYPKSPLIKRISNEDYDNIKIIEDGYNALYTARQEPDLKKRAAMLLDSYQKHPQSGLEKFIHNEYMDMLRRIFQDKKFELLESLGEEWLAVRPDDLEACALVAEAAVQLHKYQRCGECLETVYKVQPSPVLARKIQNCYQKADNTAKQTEWTEKLFKMPEFASDYMLRYEAMRKFYNEKNLPSAAEYAQLTLKSADLVQQPDKAEKEQLKIVRRTSHHIIASNLLAKENFAEAASEFERAIAAEKYGGGYHGIGLCLDKTREIEKALIYYAAAELMGEGEAQKAKERLEVLYKSLHNDTLIGIDKVYKKAKELLEES